MKDVTETKKDGIRAWRIVSHIGDRDGACKTHSGGLAMVNARALEMFVFDMYFYDGAVNPFVDIGEYLAIVRKFRGPDDNLLAALRYQASLKESLFKKGNLGKNTIPKYLLEQCKALGIHGKGIFDHVTMHRFRATVISQVKAARFDDSSVALCRGELGQQQQAAIFGQPVFVAPLSSGSAHGSDKSGQKREEMGGHELVAVEEPKSRNLQKENQKRHRGNEANEAFNATQNMSGQIIVNINYHSGDSGTEKRLWTPKHWLTAKVEREKSKEQRGCGSRRREWVQCAHVMRIIELV
ncbi:hypothetical protein FGB62_106g06 [Gracilaria domingensis]|nr:hypothetical protein FGB62_106g06 [Gracilaria domingensis]